MEQLKGIPIVLPYDGLLSIRRFDLRYYLQTLDILPSPFTPKTSGTIN